jgi:hypothetical protein
VAVTHEDLGGKIAAKAGFDLADGSGQINKIGGVLMLQFLSQLAVDPGNHGLGSGDVQAGKGSGFGASDNRPGARKSQVKGQIIGQVTLALVALDGGQLNKHGRGTNGDDSGSQQN